MEDSYISEFFNALTDIVVVVLDDWQWVDDASQQLLSSLLQDEYRLCPSFLPQIYTQPKKDDR
jgi:predicted ATPase